MRIFPKVMSSQWRMDECSDAALRAVVFSHRLTLRCLQMPTVGQLGPPWSGPLRLPRTNDSGKWCM